MEKEVERIIILNEEGDWVYSLADGNRIGLAVPESTAKRLEKKEMGGLVFFRSGWHTDIKLLEEPSEYSKAFKDTESIHIQIGEEQFYFKFKDGEIGFATKGLTKTYYSCILFDDGSIERILGKQLDDKEFEGKEASTEGILVFDKSPTHIGVEGAKKIHEAYLENNLGTSKHRMPGKDYEELNQRNEKNNERWIEEVRQESRETLERWGEQVRKGNEELKKHSEEALERWGEQVRQRTKEEFVPHRTKSLKNIAWAHASATISDKDIAISAAQNFIDEHLKHMPYYELHEDKESVSVTFSFDKKRFE